MTAELPSINERLDRASQVENLQHSEFQRITTAFLTGKASPAVLSVSCGNGIFDYLLARNIEVDRFVSTDVVENPVGPSDQELLRSLTGNQWSFEQVEADSCLPFPDASFDLSFSQDVIEHTRRPGLFLSEQFRVLRPGGLVVVGTPNIFRPASLIQLLCRRRKFPETIGTTNQLGDYVHETEYFEEILELLLEESGFRNIEVSCLYFGLNKLRLNFVDQPKRGLPRRLCHFLMATGQKPLQLP